MKEVFRKGLYKCIKFLKGKTNFNLTFFFFRKTVLMESNFKPDRQPRLKLLRLYNCQLRRWYHSMTPYEAETFKKHNFGNVGSLLEVEINWWLIENLVARWDIVDLVSRFKSIDLCPTIEESRIIRAHYNIDSIVTPPLDQGFIMRMSKDLGIKRKILGPRIKMNECPLNFLSNLFASQDAYERTNLSSSHPEKNGIKLGYCPWNLPS